MDPKTPRTFVRTFLPWLAAAGMLGLYLVTLNKEVTLASVMPVARATGVDWQPTYIAPFTWLVTTPARWFPAGSQVFGLNLIGAICAALTMALLARSVALLPHDRTHDQRIREQSETGLLSTPMAWIPPLFAVLLLGLQRSFWENSIICSGETIDVLLIAYVIRALLEFRVSGRDSWLWKAALVYGIGMANNFAFIAFAPAMLVAVVWLKRLRLFEFGFLVRFVFFGLVGLCFYFILPIVQSSNSVADTTFWQALKVNLGYQKQVLLSPERWRPLWLGGYPLVLMLTIAIRWPTGFGDSSRVGSAVGTIMAHLLHIVLLAFTIIMAFDVPGSPRHIGRGLAYLGTYYMSALAAGYFVGYLLLVFSDYSARKKRPAPGMVPLSYAMTALVCIVAVAVPVKLALDNWNRIAVLNRPEFRNLAQRLLKSLPAQPSVVISDDALRLYAVALLGGRQQGHIFLHSRSLDQPNYLRFLRKTYPGQIPDFGPEANTAPVPANVSLSIVTRLYSQRPVMYLHPSFGYFFEAFYAEPAQLAYRLLPYPTNAIEVPVASPELITRQNEMWQQLTESTLKPIAAEVNRLTPEERNTQMDLVYSAACYSQLLTVWSVELLRAGRTADGIRYLDQALALNTNNASAFITREAVAMRANGKNRLEQLSPEAERRLQAARGIDGLLNEFGPVDEPTFRAEIGQYMAGSGLLRQAAQNLLRALALVPDDLGYQITLANIYLASGQNDRAAALIRAARAKHSLQSLQPPTAIELVRSEAAVLASNQDFAGAEKLLQTLVRQYPEQDGAYVALSQYYLSRADTLRQSGNAAAAGQALTNAIAVAQQQIQQQPENANAHFNAANLYMFVPDYERAIAGFTRVLDLDPKNFAALLNRAIANLQARKLDTAKSDYEKLLSRTQTDFRIYYGLAEIAYQQKDWEAAEDYYKQYLRYAAANSEEAKFVRNRLAEVKKKA